MRLGNFFSSLAFDFPFFQIIRVPFLLSLPMMPAIRQAAILTHFLLKTILVSVGVVCS